MTTTIEPGTIPGPAPAPAPAAPAPGHPSPAPAAVDSAPVTPTPAPAADEPAPALSDSAPAAPLPAPAEAPDRSGIVMRWVIGLTMIGAVVIAAIGFAASYETLHALALEKGFGPFVASAVPIGVDAGILVMYGMDLALAWRRTPRPLLRYIGHFLTLATIFFNATASGRPLTADPVGAALHGVMPVLFVATVEAARHLVIRTARVRMGAASNGVPLHRWLLSPVSSWTLYRRMRLWEIPSYAQAVQLEHDRTVYRAYLAHKHGRQWKKKARAEELLPFTMAPFGLGVEEALRLPQQRKEAEMARAVAEQERADALAAAEEMRQVEAERRRAEAAVARMRISATVTAAEHTITAEQTTAEAEARAATAEAAAQSAAREKVAAARAETDAHNALLEAESARLRAEREARAAERAAREEEAAEKSAATAEAEAREAEALRIAAQARVEAAEAEERAARLEKETAESREAAATYEREQERLAAERAQYEAAQVAARRQEAEDREAAARAELAALEAEDLARLSSRERAERRVARLILAAGGTSADTADVLRERVTLEKVGELLGVARTTAGERRQAAADLIMGGYTG
ncbi:DUF2637 domain-containing protein [Streptomyces sp. NPDC088745]|uniref:DUF2637 domain-containing protein n=1 Tax=Streptomyces sp. NPDC088745 TaxID=3365884 RepID=UPI003823514B